MTTPNTPIEPGSATHPAEVVGFDYVKYRKLLEMLAVKAGYANLGALSEAATGSRTLLYAAADPSRRRAMPRLETVHAVAKAVGVKASDILKSLGY